MNVVYVVSAYKLPHQLVRLVRQLHEPDATFFVHVDRRSPAAVHVEVAEALAGLDRVHLLESHDSPYGGFGHVRATLKGLAAAERLDVAFDYVILLTGQDYPIKPAAERAVRLGAAGGRSFLAHTALPNPGWHGGGRDRVERWHVRVGERHVRFPNRFAPVPLRRRIPGGLRPFGGSAYWCLSREAAAYVLRFVREHRRFVRYFRTVDVPDEVFFHTILLNSPLRDGLVNDNLRYIDWSRLPAPAILGVDDFDAIIRSNALFARKFDVTVDPAVLDLLDGHADAMDDGV